MTAFYDAPDGAPASTQREVWVSDLQEEQPVAHLLSVGPVSSRRYAEAVCGKIARFGGSNGRGGVMLPFRHAQKFAQRCKGCFGEDLG